MKNVLVSFLCLCTGFAAGHAALQQAGGASKHSRSAITDFPYYHGKMPSAHYGGYITVDKTSGRKLYYYFATSQGDPTRDPTILWLNGGPGCSSFDGFVYEHGPFNFEFKKAKMGPLHVSTNDFAWTTTANVIYLDSPSGVGLSYSDDPADYVSNDTRTAADTHVFLREFYQEYEEFLDNDLYIIGESYAGIYVPMLAQVVLDGNDEGQKPKLNLKGYAIGNGCTDLAFDANAIVPFAYGAGLLSQDIYADMVAACDGGNYWNVTQGGRCGELVMQAFETLDDINIYDILAPCYHGGEQRARRLEQARQQQGGMRRWPLGGGVEPGLVPSWGSLLGSEGQLGHTPACLDSREMLAFLNDDKVRAALHAAPIAEAGIFADCSDRLTYTHDTGSMVPVHADLLARGLRALVYSGDHDMCVPHVGSEAWTRSMGLPLKRAWRHWLVDDQVAGYVTEYEGLTYATIKGAGHMVPQSKPKQALHLISHFLTNSEL